MNKKIVGIFIMMLFLFSALPRVAGTNHKNEIQESLMTTKNYNNLINPFHFVLMYGRIKYNGEAIMNNQTCYNVTPIFLRYRLMAWDPTDGFFYGYCIVTSNPYYIPKDYFTGFIGEKFLFLIDTF